MVAPKVVVGNRTRDETEREREKEWGEDHHPRCSPHIRLATVAGHLAPSINEYAPIAP
jgi:hypothetical protein